MKLWYWASPDSTLFSKLCQNDSVLSKNRLDHIQNWLQERKPTKGHTEIDINHEDQFKFRIQIPWVRQTSRKRNQKAFNYLEMNAQFEGKREDSLINEGHEWKAELHEINNQQQKC